MSADDRLIASLSGGKDSTAMALYLREQGMEFTPVFMDTGWEADQTYAYLDEVIEPLFGPLVRLRSEVELAPDLDALAQVYEARLGRPSAMIRWILKKGLLPSRHRKWCTDNLKIKPFAAWLESLDEDVTVAVGVRAAESEARARFKEREWAPWFDAEIWRPLLRWTEQDVIDIHSRHGIKPCSVYLKGATRLGCWPCIHTVKHELRLIAEIDPARIDLIEDLEVYTTQRRHDAARARGDEPEIDLLGWFHGRADSSRAKDSTPIRRAVEWSRTSRGGRQLLIGGVSERERGCARWGLCEPEGTK